MSRKRTARYEIITWRDAWSGYNEPTELGDIRFGHYLVSTGWLVKENRAEVILAAQINLHPNDTRIRHAFGILKRNIVSRCSRQVCLPRYPED
jgi:hypothetical protein